MPTQVVNELMPHIRFSILIATYNQRDFIRDAVDSALLQRDSSMEIIVVDDGSNDGTAEILRQYGDSIQLLAFAGNRGAAEARNQAAARAKGEYLVFLDGDDLIMPWALDVYDRIIMERRPAFILARYSEFTGPIPILTDQDVPDRIEFVEYESLMAKDRSCGMSASTFVIQRQAFQNVRGWSPGIFQMDSVDLAAKLGCSGHVILICLPYTVFYRAHASQTIRNVPPFLRMAYHILRKEKAGEYPGSLGQRFRRYAWLGGIIWFWVQRALRAGYYLGAVGLGVSGLPMILAAITKRVITWIKGRRPVEILDLHLEGSFRSAVLNEPRNLQGGASLSR